MTIEELFGTLQQSVVGTWRKHLRTSKYSKHMALDEFYKEMPEKVDALIEAWMGVNGKKPKEFDNILKSKNMNTLDYLKSLKKVVKDGYELMDENKELEALLDDIAELISSTLYKVKELNENKSMKNLSDFINESLVNESKINEAITPIYPPATGTPPAWDLVKLIRNINGDIKRAQKIDYDDYMINYNDNVKNDLDVFFTILSTLVEGSIIECGNMDEGGFSDPDIKEEIGLERNDHGFALHSDGDDGDWSVFTYKKRPNAQQKKFIQELVDLFTNDGWTIGETF